MKFPKGPERLLFIPVIVGVISFVAVFLAASHGVVCQADGQLLPLWERALISFGVSCFPTGFTSLCLLVHAVVFGLS